MRAGLLHEDGLEVRRGGRHHHLETKNVILSQVILMYLSHFMGYNGLYLTKRYLRKKGQNQENKKKEVKGNKKLDKKFRLWHTLEIPSGEDNSQNFKGGGRKKTFVRIYPPECCYSFLFDTFCYFYVILK